MERNITKLVFIHIYNLNYLVINLVSDQEFLGAFLGHGGLHFS